MKITKKLYDDLLRVAREQSPKCVCTILCGRGEYLMKGEWVCDETESVETRWRDANVALADRTKKYERQGMRQMARCISHLGCEPQASAGDIILLFDAFDKNGDLKNYGDLHVIVSPSEGERGAIRAFWILFDRGTREEPLEIVEDSPAIEDIPDEHIWLIRRRAFGEEDVMREQQRKYAAAAKHLYRELEKSGTWDSTRDEKPLKVDLDQWRPNLRASFHTIEKTLWDFAENFSRWGRGALSDDQFIMTAEAIDAMIVDDVIKSMPPEAVAGIFTGSKNEMAGFFELSRSILYVTNAEDAEDIAYNDHRRVLLTTDQKFIREHLFDMLVKYLGNAVVLNTGTALHRGEMIEMRRLRDKWPAEHKCLLICFPTSNGQERETILTLVLSSEWVENVLMGTESTRL